MMTRAEAEKLAAKRERHKSPGLMKNWCAVHDSVKGWHVALRAAFVDAAGDALMARVRGSLAALPEDDALAGERRGGEGR